MAEKNSNSTYTAESITVLEGLEAVRKRPAMYIGSTDTRGLHHLVYEVVDNSIDEAMAGFCTHVDVTLNADGSCTVRDDGRGIPVDMHPTEHRPAVEVVLTVLHAGGKFGNGGYKVSGGLHGVGVSCVNALSDWLEVEVRRDGKVHRMRFSRGHVTKPLEVVGSCPADETGTTVTFHLDKEIFHDDQGNTYDFKWDILAKRFKELSFLNPGVTINFADENTGKKETYYHKDGIVGFIRSVTKGRASIEPDPAVRDARLPCDRAEVISVKGVEDGVSAEIALQYVDEKYDESIFTFANNINTIEGGTHLSGFCSALTGMVNNYARANKLLKESEENLAGEDIREGIVCVISVKVPNPQFEGQTKTKLGNSNVAGIVQRLVGSKLKDYFDENPKVAQAIVTKAVGSQRARFAARKAREMARNDNKKLGKFLFRWRTLEFLLEFRDFFLQPVESTELVGRKSDDARVFGYGLEDGLADPPYGVGDEFEAAGFVEAFCGLDEAYITLVDEVGETKSLVLILLGDGNHKSQIGFSQAVESSLVASLDTLG
jgi:DNA gyrase subunit B